MTKRQAVERFRSNILPSIPADDKPAKRMAWNDYIDALHRDGAITDRQASNWGHPACIR